MAEEPRLPDPAYSPEEVARAILYAAEHPKREIYVGGAAKVMSKFGGHFPRVMDWLSESVMMPQEKRKGDPAHHPQGTLHRPDDSDGHVRGDHPGMKRNVSVYTRAVTQPVPVLPAVLLAAAGVAAAAWWGGRRDRATV